MKTYLKLSTSAVALLGAALMLTNPAYAKYHRYDRDASNVSVNVNQSSKGDVNGSSAVNAAVLNGSFAGGRTGKVTGNVGINNAAGTGNVQANASAINVGAKKEARVHTDVDQQVGHTWHYYDHDPMTDNTKNPTNLAEITNYALMNASGNIGVNNAAGHGNLQSNTLAISVNTSSFSKASADADTDQKILGVDNQSGSYTYVKKWHYVQYDSDNDHEGPNGYDSDDHWHWSGHYKKVAVYGPQAIIDGDALENAVGKIGVNNAAGNGNAQSNSLTVVEAHTVRATGSTDQNLWVQDNSGTSYHNPFSNPVLNNATIGGNALANASGDIGVNNAAGDFNAQSGTVIIAAALTGGTLGDMSAQVSQHVSVPSGDCGTIGNVNNASLGGSALQNASGAISVNNAAGVGNAQSNMLVLGSFVSGGSR